MSLQGYIDIEHPGYTGPKHVGNLQVKHLIFQ